MQSREERIEKPPRSGCRVLLGCLCALVVWGGICGNLAADEGARSLPTVQGSSFPWKKTANGKARVVCFLGVECPLAKLYGPRLQVLFEAYGDQGIEFLGVDSNLQDSLSEIQSYVERSGITFPFVKDYDQRLANELHATRTPEILILDPQGIVVYQGRIDDQYLPGIVKPLPKKEDLKQAIESILAGRPIDTPRTEVVGCLIGKKKATPSQPTVTYTGKIAKIFQDHCVECHRSGEIGPFAMTEYEELVGWGEMIMEVVEQRRMPPWHATHDHVPLRNARSMTAEEIDTLRRWIDEGMPYGDPQALPKPLEFASGWRLPKDPDLIVSMRSEPFVVPEQGTVEYQYFVADPGLTEDRWVSAAQVIPGNASVVHHVIVFIRPPDGSDFRGIGWLTAYVPGQRSMIFPPGAARKIPAGSKLVFQMHYTPNGRKQEDCSQVGLVFAEEADIKEEVITLMGIDQEFEIPPQTKNFPVEARVRWLPPGGRLLAVAPHMHVRGESFRLEAKTKGQPQTLLEVPRYDFNWQHTYEFLDPIPLDTIESLGFTATFDNSADNPVNPDPSEHVYWGDQTWEEMAVAFFEVAVPRQGATTQGDRFSVSKKSKPKTDPEAFADAFLRELDKNRDGTVTYGEAPVVIQRYSFWRFDRNRDYKIERQELIEAVK